ncbi:MAG TPA: glycosyltransferase family 4 protein [Vicinamibacterales bacterium]|jgi:glycosyltransferase involved in cell wall biosynthesis
MSKVLLVTNIFPPEIGGPATFIDRLGHSLARRDHRVTVVCTSQGSRHESDRERPFAVRRVNFTKRERYEVLVRMRLALEMARHRLIFVNGLERYVAEVNRVTRRPYVLKIVGDAVWETARNRGMTDLSIDDFQTHPTAQATFAADIQGRNAWVAAARHIVVPSEYLRRLVQGWGVAADRITVVQNGTITTGPAAPATRTRERFRALFVGRLTNWKGVETLLLAARDVPDVELEIVGDGPEWPHLVELSAQLGLGERAIFRGRLSAAEVRHAMDRAHALVLTSLYEGLSHTVLEAFAAGLPCIVSDRGGNEEVVSNGRNGVIVPPQNVGSLAGALRALADDEPWRRRLAAAALETARVFDLTSTVSRTEQLLLNAV